MSELQQNNINQEIEESEDNRTFEEKVRDGYLKIKPYTEIIFNKKKTILAFNLVVLLLSIVFLFLIKKPYFNATVSILPEYGSKSGLMNQLSGLAAIAGINVGEVAPTEIYQNLIKSEQVMSNVIYAKYKTEKFRDSVNLIQYFETESDESNPELKNRKEFLSLYKLLTEAKISTEIDRLTKILSVSVEMPEPQLAADVANKIAESLDLYIRTQRKSFATEQIFYLEKRIKEVSDSLVSAEEALKRFREQNRIVSQSPALLLEQGRLMRNVEILQTVYIELNKQIELAKIEQIRDAPVLNIKEYAKNPVQKAGPRRLSSIIQIMIFSLVLSLVYVIFSERIRKALTLVKSSK
ncbi:Lipopolysaccharide biosynthesis protein [Ignavibacterium album JCM 16511]|uniref:Lipopolysaccharide biosynthesis protein n=1 Tax=Ignavibacterium album (strain DSM 19864 / JCM 16511 / NBRC 101810 / Mat9-16) TaxID=945713 RepID=I0AJH6_IGNAJ|nr:Wzz/FepE/Etk N-terminal domain-containing protein [Ignavibacterium album]AFH49133.1 Lipopolysaccharide biosynthesis protein [Ignavibacterium album JCM 16511]